jgi:DNA-binding GntR family transcriptional regulator
MRYRSGSKSGRATEAFKQHTEIYKALYERNRKKAERLMIQHLRSSKDNMIQIIASIGD